MTIDLMFSKRKNILITEQKSAFSVLPSIRYLEMDAAFKINHNFSKQVTVPSGMR